MGKIREEAFLWNLNGFSHEGGFLGFQIIDHK